MIPNDPAEPTPATTPTPEQARALDDLAWFHATGNLHPKSEDKARAAKAAAKAKRRLVDPDEDHDGLEIEMD